MAFDDGVKTVSGSIAHTDDAATKVPFVSVKCGIEPTLTGVTKIDVVRPDGNILQTVATSKTQNGITWTVNADGSVTLEGTSTARTYLYVHLYHKILPKDATLTVSVEGLYDNGASDVFLNLPYSNNGTTYSGTYGQVTWGTPKKTISYTADKYIGFLLDCPANVTTNQTIKVMVTIGSEAKTFEPYVSPVTHNVELGRTVHGGYAEIVSGSGATTHNTIDMGLLDWTYHAATSTYTDFFDCYLPNDSITGDSTVAFDGLTADYKSIQSSLIALPNQPQYDDMVMALAKNTRRFIICDQRYTSASALTTALTGKILVYPILNPITFTFTPREIETVGKVNNVYCDTGDTELTYHDNAHGFASVTVTKQAPDQADEVKTAYLHKVIFGGLVDVIQGKAEPKNLGELSAETYNQSQKCTWEYITGGAVVTATGTYARVGFVIPVETGKTYTVSYRGFSDGEYRRVYFNSTPALSGQFYNNVLSDTDTLYTRTFTASTDVLFVGLYVTAGTTTGTLTFSDFMLVEGDQAEDFAPHFEPFTFPPISMKTDEGENTLFANEGDSSITYRKAVD